MFIVPSPNICPWLLPQHCALPFARRTHADTPAAVKLPASRAFGAEAAGLQVIQNRCVKIEHARLFGGLHWAGVDTRVISAHRPV